MTNEKTADEILAEEEKEWEGVDEKLDRLFNKIFKETAAKTGGYVYTSPTGCRYVKSVQFEFDLNDEEIHISVIMNTPTDGNKFKCSTSR